MIEIVKESSGVFHFILKAKSGNSLLQSIAYTTEQEAQKVVSKIPITQGQYLFERRTDHNGKFLFNLKDQDGKVIGSSQLYGSEAGMENGIRNLKSSLSTLRSL